jgi:hypothetical protein
MPSLSLGVRGILDFEPRIPIVFAKLSPSPDLSRNRKDRGASPYVHVYQACARVIWDAVGRENDALQSFGRENIQAET